jgi:hypothetical protein
MIMSKGLRSWVLQGSPDAEKWYTLDRQTNTSYFELGLETVFFPVPGEIECRYLRLIQTGPNHDRRDRDRLSLTVVDFFGVLSEPNYN